MFHSLFSQLKEKRESRSQQVGRRAVKQRSQSVKSDATLNSADENENDDDDDDDRDCCCCCGLIILTDNEGGRDDGGLVKLTRLDLT